MPDGISDYMGAVSGSVVVEMTVEHFTQQAREIIFTIENAPSLYWQHREQMNELRVALAMAEDNYLQSQKGTQNV